MLAQGRFHKETPNVIDAGDDGLDPPTAPKRSESKRRSTKSNSNGSKRSSKSSGSSRSSRSSSLSSPLSSSSTAGGENRLSLSNKGVVMSKGIKLFPTTTSSTSPTSTVDQRTSGVSSSHDDDDDHSSGGDSLGDTHSKSVRFMNRYDGDDLHYHHHHQPTSLLESSSDDTSNIDSTPTTGIESPSSPSSSSLHRMNSIEQARLFAATILNESENRKQHQKQQQQQEKSGYVDDGTGILHHFTSALQYRDDPMSPSSSSFPPPFQSQSRYTTTTTTTKKKKKKKTKGLFSSWFGFNRKSNNNNGDGDFYDSDDRSVEMFVTEEGFYAGNNLKSSSSSLSSRQRQDKKQRFIVSIGLLVVALAVVASFAYFVVRSRTSSKDTNVSSAFAEERFDNITTFLLNARIVSDERTLYDESSSQYRAAQWMAQQDNEHIPVPEVDVNLAEIGKDNPFNFIQRYVLAVLWYHWGGEDGKWNNNYNFGDGNLHECAWFEPIASSSDRTSGDVMVAGVDCDEHLQVRYLSLPSNGLHGDIPEEIWHLSTLDILNLKDNAISGSIPKALKKMNHLTMIDFTSNKITGEIPHWLSDSLPSLKVLGLGQNQLQGTIPASFVHLSHLKTLSLDGNSLSGDASPIQQLNQMEFLYISDNSLTGNLDEGLLWNMPNLKEADLSNNEFSVSDVGVVPRYLFQHENLQVLDLSNNRINAMLPSKALQEGINAGSTSLAFLSFRNNSLTGTIPQTFLDSLTSLSHLDLAGNLLTGSLDMIDFSPLQGLNVLFLHDNAFSGSLDSLGTLDRISALSLYNNNITGVIEQPFCSDETQVVDILAVDCDRIDCPCCDKCCANNEDICFDVVDDERYLFDRSDYSFDPRITMDQDTDFMEGNL